LFTVDFSLSFKEKTKDYPIYDLLIDPYSPTNHIIIMLEYKCPFSIIKSKFKSIVSYLYTVSETSGMPIEIISRKHSISVLDLKVHKNKGWLICYKKILMHFAWEYTSMKGIHLGLCTHHIYFKDNFLLVWYPQCRMNSALHEIVKVELQNLLNVISIYPISNSQWVALLVIVPNKYGKWRVCIDYKEQNKVTSKDHFPLPFID